jgi:MFS family permease
MPVPRRNGGEEGVDALMRLRLSWMMGLVYAVQGAFWPVLAVHLEDLGLDGRQRGWIFATLAIGSLAMPLGFGQLVDRLMASQQVMATIFAVATGFLALFASGLVTGGAALFGLFLAFWMVTAPAYALSNTIALRHLERPCKQFAGVRLWGTFGWMAVGWMVSAVLLVTDSTRAGQGAYPAFWVAAALSALLAVYSLTLPHTPPLSVAALGEDRDSDLVRALELARRPGMTGFLITAFGVHLTAAFIYQVLPTYLAARGLPRAWIPTVLTLGQWPELLMLALLPWMIGRFGMKATLAVGIGAWLVRFGSLAVDPPLWVAIAGIPLHGVAVACFAIAGQMYTDTRAPRDLRASAQALYLVVTSGLGALCGSLLAGSLMGQDGGDAARVFLVPCVIDAALLVYFCAGFRPTASIEERAGGLVAARPLRPDDVRGTVARVGNLVTEPADG